MLHAGVAGHCSRDAGDDRHIDGSNVADPSLPVARYIKWQSGWDTLHEQGCQPTLGRSRAALSGAIGLEPHWGYPVLCLGRQGTGSFFCMLDISVRHALFVLSPSTCKPDFFATSVDAGSVLRRALVALQSSTGCPCLQVAQQCDWQAALAAMTKPMQLRGALVMLALYKAGEDDMDPAASQGQRWIWDLLQGPVASPLSFFAAKGATIPTSAAHGHGQQRVTLVHALACCPGFTQSPAGVPVNVKAWDSQAQHARVTSTIAFSHSSLLADMLCD